MSVSEFIQIRRSLGLTQAEFGAKLGVTQKTVSCIECGHKRLTSERAALATLLAPVMFHKQGITDNPDPSMEHTKDIIP